MKTALLAFVLALAFSSQSLLEASPEQVVDTSGKVLRAGVNYNILVSMPYTSCRSPQRLGLSKLGKCPLDVVVVNIDHGLLLRFIPINSKKGVIRVSTDLNIMFPPNVTCPHHSTVWRVDNSHVSKGNWFVTTGGVVGNPGRETIGNWFKIEKYEGAYNYKLVYCPSVCPSCKHECKNVGMVVDENGNQRLALSYVPFQFRFYKA
ncbi:hypothetical protein VNO78_32593 [Psophocarpus tetragonolobus]|uniref:Miraculin n=1 Tax=Psophocarpus tetragonolobus TaxID=3891 RepID=A0AAN9NVL1_PSOTE